MRAVDDFDAIGKRAAELKPGLVVVSFEEGAPPVEEQIEAHLGDFGPEGLIEVSRETEDQKIYDAHGRYITVMRTKSIKFGPARHSPSV